MGKESNARGSNKFVILKLVDEEQKLENISAVTPYVLHGGGLQVQNKSVNWTLFPLNKNKACVGASAVETITNISKPVTQGPTLVQTSQLTSQSQVNLLTKG